MTGLPDTRSPGRRRTAHPWRIVLGLVAALLLLGLLAALAPEGDGLPAERIYSPRVEEVGVGEEGASRFRPGTREVGVHVRVRDLPSPGRLSATVERYGRSSTLGRLLGTGGIRAVGGREERLSVSDGGASGIVAFEVRPSSGGALPEGLYAVEVHAISRSGGDDRLLARTYFRVGG